jgi:Uma2 family endonuclease
VGRARVRIQLGFAASEYSEPEPDVAIVPKDEQRTDQPARATLVIEVALSSLRFDRTAKASIYARAGIAAYWIVNVAERCIEVHAAPGADQYGEKSVHRGDERLAVPGFPEVTVSVNEVFG